MRTTRAVTSPVALSFWLVGCVGAAPTLTATDSGSTPDGSHTNPPDATADSHVGHDAAGDAHQSSDTGQPDVFKAPDAGEHDAAGDVQHDAAPQDAGRDSGPVCTLGAKSCNGTQPTICDSSANGNVVVNNGAACAGTTPSCIDGVCIACTMSSQCGGTTPVCDTTTSTCVECLAGQTQMVGCGNCGTGMEMDTCQNDTWVAGACSGTGCGGSSPATQACDTYGVETCDSTCTLGTTCSCPLVPVCVPNATKCTLSTQQATCDACGQWGAGTACTGECVGVACATPIPCTKIVTSTLSETNPFAIPVVISYSMIGGGGGGGSDSGSNPGGGGGGGSSAVLIGTSAQGVAAGGTGGAPATTAQFGGAGAQASGSFTLFVTDNLTVFAGGGGGGGGDQATFNSGGGGGGSGYYGGGGGSIAGNATGGSNTGGIGGNNSATNGSLNSGGAGYGSFGGGGNPGVAGNGGGGAPGGGGGGGYGAGGGVGGGDPSVTCGGTGGGSSGGAPGGSNGGTSCAGSPGSAACTGSSTLAAAIMNCDVGGGGGSYGVYGAGGWGGIVYLTYTSPTGVCSL